MKKLDKHIKRTEKRLRKPLQWKWIIVLLVITGLSAAHIYYYQDSKWIRVSATLVWVCPILIWILFGIRYKGRKKENKVLNELKKIKKEDNIKVISVNANRMIAFEEKDDEGNLFLIEEASGKCFYLWDDEIPEQCGFPRSSFEIYIDENFVIALGRKVNCTGERIEPIKVNEKVKWEYFKPDFPEDLRIETKTFDEVVSAVTSIKELQQ